MNPVASIPYLSLFLEDHMEKICTNRIVKVGIVTDNAEETAKKLTELFEVVEPYDNHEPPAVPFSSERYQLYKGQPAKDIHMNVRLVYVEPIYFEIIEPIGDAESPWHDHFKKYGTSVCFFAFYINGFEEHIDFMGKQGFPLIFKEEKGFERYAYFDTMSKLGFTLEMKERIPKPAEE